MAEIYLEPGSPAERIALFLYKNPTEVLNRSDVAAKLAIAPGGVSTALESAVLAGLVTIANDGDLGRVWQAGPRLKHWTPRPALLAGAFTSPMPAPSAKPSSGTRSGTKPRTTRQMLPILNLTQLSVATNVALPPSVIARKGQSRHDALLNLLVADGMSVIGIPIAYQGALIKAAMTYLEARPAMKASCSLYVRKIAHDPTLCGIWRMKRSAADEAVPRRRPAVKV